MKVLMSAYACEPNKGSEPGVGWNWALQAAAHGHDVHVVTRRNNGPAIEAELAKRPVAGLTFHYLDRPAPYLWAKKRFRYNGMLWYYYVWQRALRKLARRLHDQHRFDLAHHVTFVNDWMPSGLAGLDLPFIWGPVGGSTHMWPEQIEVDLPPYARRHETIRRWVIYLFKRFDPFLRKTRRSATTILVYTDEAMAGLPPSDRRRARPIVHIGLSGEEVPANPKAQHGPTLEVVTGGRLVHWKGFDLLIEGFAQLGRDTEARLSITGVGPYRPYMEQLVQELEIGDSVEFLGHLPSREDVFALIASADLYALPTLRDGPPVAILEAMALGIPILCLDWGATGELVPDQAGLKVTAGDRAQIVEGISEALRWSVGHRTELQEMGAAGRDHVHRVHDWSRIGDEVDSLYRKIVGWERG